MLPLTILKIDKKHKIKLRIKDYITKQEQF